MYYCICLCIHPTLYIQYYKHVWKSIGNSPQKSRGLTAALDVAGIDLAASKNSEASLRKQLEQKTADLTASDEELFNAKQAITQLEDSLVKNTTGAATLQQSGAASQQQLIAAQRKLADLGHQVEVLTAELITKVFEF